MIFLELFPRIFRSLFERYDGIIPNLHTSSGGVAVLAGMVMPFLWVIDSAALSIPLLSVGTWAIFVPSPMAQEWSRMHGRVRSKGSVECVRS